MLHPGIRFLKEEINLDEVRLRGRTTIKVTLRQEDGHNRYVRIEEQKGN